MHSSNQKKSTKSLTAASSSSSSAAPTRLEQIWEQLQIAKKRRLAAFEKIYDRRGNKKSGLLGWIPAFSKPDAAAWDTFENAHHTCVNAYKDALNQVLNEEINYHIPTLITLMSDYHSIAPREADKFIKESVASEKFKWPMAAVQNKAKTFHPMYPALLQLLKVIGSETPSLTPAEFDAVITSAQQNFQAPDLGGRHAAAHYYIGRACHRMAKQLSKSDTENRPKLQIIEAASSSSTSTSSHTNPHASKYLTSAHTHFKAAIAFAHADAHYYLGYLRGEPLRPIWQNPTNSSARDFFCTAQLGHVDALRESAKVREFGGNYQYYTGLHKHGAPDFDKLYVYYRLAAIQGDAFSQSRLGEVHEHGLGNTPKNLNLAFRYYSEAAKQGHSDACYHVGRFYARGLIVSNGFFITNAKPNYAKAAKYYAKAAAQGHASAQVNLGILYERGQHPSYDSEPDFNEAKICYTTAKNKQPTPLTQNQTTDPSIESATSAGASASDTNKVTLLHHKRLAALRAFKTSGLVADDQLQVFKHAHIELCQVYQKSIQDSLENQQWQLAFNNLCQLFTVSSRVAGAWIRESRIAEKLNKNGGIGIQSADGKTTSNQGSWQGLLEAHVCAHYGIHVRGTNGNPIQAQVTRVILRQAMKSIPKDNPAALAQVPAVFLNAYACDLCNTLKNKHHTASSQDEQQLTTQLHAVLDAAAEQGDAQAHYHLSQMDDPLTPVNISPILVRKYCAVAAAQEVERAIKTLMRLAANGWAGSTDTDLAEYYQQKIAARNKRNRHRTTRNTNEHQTDKTSSQSSAVANSASLSSTTTQAQATHEQARWRYLRELPPVTDPDYNTACLQIGKRLISKANKASPSSTLARDAAYFKTLMIKQGHADTCSAIAAHCVEQTLTKEAQSWYQIAADKAHTMACDKFAELHDGMHAGKHSAHYNSASVGKFFRENIDDPDQVQVDLPDDTVLTQGSAAANTGPFVRRNSASVSSSLASQFHSVPTEPPKQKAQLTQAAIDTMPGTDPAPQEHTMLAH